MTDYISREAAIEAIEETDWYHQGESKNMVQGANSLEHQAWYKEQDVFAALKSIPAADVRENKRGKWIWHETPLHDGTIAFAIQCSVCKEIFTETDVCEKPMEYNFCPNCGADMREEQT